MKADLTAWALWAAAVSIPVTAYLLGAEFVIRDIDGGPYRMVSPLWCIAWQPVVFFGLLLRSGVALNIGLVPGVFVGGGMLLGSVVQLPLALLAPRDAIANTPRLEIVAVHAAAMLTGAACLGLAARVLSPKTSRSSS